jgi:hypothetical protein
VTPFSITRTPVKPLRALDEVNVAAVAGVDRRLSASARSHHGECREWPARVDHVAVAELGTDGALERADEAR